MELKIKAGAQTYLATKIKPTDLVLLALDDGSNKFSNMGGSCTIGSKFQLVVVDQADPDFQVPVANNLNFKLFTGEPELTYLGAGLNLDYKNGFMTLSDNSGILDGAVTVSRYQAPTTEELAEKMKTDGVHNC